MPNCHSIEVNASNISERFDLISSFISDQFRAAWTAKPIGADPRPACITWATAQGVSFCAADMPPQRLVNANSRPSGSGLYYIYTADQPSRVRLHTGRNIQLQDCDFLIHDADLPLDWSVHCNYSTRSLLIDKDLFHEYVPPDSPLIGRPLRFEYGVQRILSEIMEAACEVTSAGSFEQAGPKLARAFLDLLTLMPPRDDITDQGPSKNALQLRRYQVQAYIDKHFAQPDLCTASIARHLQLSPRYLQMAFSSQETTLSDYMRRRRLTACASMLQDPAMAGRTITDIALSCGFNSSAYFSTEFRRAYGMSPRRYRTVQLQTAGLARS
jgi:AraC-like DNA-binding protein